MNVFVSKLSFIFVFITLVLFGLWIGMRLFFILIPFMIAYGLSKPISKLTKTLHKKIPIPYSILTFIVVILFVSIFVTSVSFVVYKVAIALSGFSAYLSAIIKTVQDFTTRIGGIEIKLPWFDAPVDINVILLQFYDLILNSITKFANSLVDALLSMLKTIPTIAFFFFFLFISLYFFVFDQDRVKDFLNTIDQKITSPFFKLLKEKTFNTLKSYIKAQLILVSITFVISLVALTILKIPFSPLVAFGIAFVDLIPMVGPAFIYMPWIIFALLISEYSTGIGLLIAYLVTTLTRQTIEPKIVSSKIGTHPLITIISMYTCYRIFGVFGFILGAILVMIGLIIWNIYKELKQKHEQ